MASEKGREEMKLGEYFLHIFLEDGSSFDIAEGSDAKIAYEVNAFGEKKISKTLPNITRDSTIFLGEHFFFTKIFDNRETLENENLEISVIQKGTFQSKLIGSVSMNISAIYFEPEHVIKHKWFILQNKQKDFQNVKGYVKMSVAFTSDKDKKVELVPQTSGDKNGKDSMEIPPSISLKTKQLKIQVIRGENFPKLDMTGAGVDAYVEFSFGSSKLKTKTVSSLNPVWNLDVFLPIVEPSFINALKMNVIDYDTIGSNEYIGAASIDMKKIKQNKYKDFTWINLYGAPKEASSDVVEYMNDNPKKATSFRGSVLLSVQIEDTKEVKSGVFEKTADTNSRKPSKNFLVIADFRSIFNLRAKPSSNFSIRVTCGKHQTSSQPLSYNDGCLPCYQRLALKLPWEGTLSDLPDVIIYLLRDNKILSYWRAADNTKFKSLPGYRDVLFAPERGSNEGGKAHEAGVANMRVCVCEEGEWGEVQSSSHLHQSQQSHRSHTSQSAYNNNNSPVIPWSTEPSRPSPSRLVLFANLYMAKKIITADDDGLCDPLVYFDHHGAQSKSSVYKNSLNPVWSERVMINTFSYGDYLPPVAVKLFDLDEKFIGSNDYEFLGSDIVPLTPYPVTSDINSIPEMKWYMMKDDQGNITASLLMSFTVYNGNGGHVDPQTIRGLNIQKTPYNIKLNILGLRDLQSTGLFPVKHPYIKFHVGALRQGGESKGASMFDILTARANKGGPDASFSELVTFEGYLPVEVKKMPSVTGMVYDNTALSLGESLIGVFSIDLPAAYAESLYFFVEKLQNVLAMISNEPTKARATPGLKRMIEEHSRELETCIELADNDQFKRRALRADKNEKVGALKTSELINKLATSSQFFGSKLGALAGGQSNLQKGGQSQFGSNNNKSQSNALNVSYASELPVVIFPKYKKDANGVEVRTMEFKEPSLDKYDPLGFDTPAKKNRHYRLRVDTPLEKSDYLLSSIFTTIPITRGKQLKEEKGFFSRLLTKSNEYKQVGRFKGAVSVLKDKSLQDLCNLDLREELSKVDLPYDEASWKLSKIDKDILREVEVRVRLYLIEAQIVESDDIGSESDVYTKIYLGNKLLFDNKKSRINDKQNPKFYQTFEFKAVFPGTSGLHIKFYDYDPIGSDDLIGQTTIDLEDRFFDKRWRTETDHPVEKRDIRLNELSNAKGFTKLWVEIDKTDDSVRMARPLMDISPVPDTKLQFRIVVWEANDVHIEDPEGLGDVFVRCSFPSLGLASNTDTHWRSSGFASFNWRILFDLKADVYTSMQQYALEVQVWDKDILSGNDYICFYRFEPAQIYELIERCVYNQKSAKYSVKSDTAKRDKSGRSDLDDGKVEVIAVKNPNRKDSQNCKLLLSLEVLTEDEYTLLTLEQKSDQLA